MVDVSSTPFREAQQFKQHYVYLDKYDNIMQAITANIDYRFSEDCGIIINGPSGIGKSALSKQYLSDNAEQDTPEKDGVHGIYVEVCGNGFEALLVDMLEQLHCKDPSFKTVAAKKKRVIDLINALDVKVVFIDEAQEGLPGAVLPSSGFIKLLKEFTNKTSASWVLLGPEKVKEVASVDEQMEERFTQILTLETFTCNSNEGTEELMEYLFDVLQKVPRKKTFFQFLNASLNEAGDDFFYKDDVDYSNLLRFLLATLGRPRRIKTLLMDCIRLTSSAGDITKGLLSKVYQQKYRNDDKTEWINPFTASIVKVKKELIARGLYA